MKKIFNCLTAEPSNRLTGSSIKQLNRGFTLVELLVVIAIISLIATMGFVSYSGNQKAARDSRRRSDLRQYQELLESYANKNNNYYPARSSGTTFTPSSSGICGVLGIPVNCPVGFKSDTDSTYDYRYRSNTGSLTDFSATATSYVVWTKMENVNTTTYYIICSNGKVGFVSSAPGGNCPL